MEFVILPDVKTLVIDNFGLYKGGSFKKDFNKELNLFLGVNAVGKTTTIKTLAYAIVGLAEENNKEYMEQKNNSSTSKDVGITETDYFNRYRCSKGQPTVFVRFNLGNNLFCVKRNLIEHNILEFSVNGMPIFENIEQTYKNYFKKYSGMKLEDYKKILYTLSIRLEEASSILFRHYEQHVILRTLLFERSFHKDFIKAEENFISSHNKFYKMRKELLDIKNKIKEVSKEISQTEAQIDEVQIKLDEKNKEIWDKTIELEKKIKNNEEQIKNLKIENDNNRILIKSFSGNFKELSEERKIAKEELNTILNDIKAIEKENNLRIEDDSEFYRIINRFLSSNDKCFLCDSKLDTDKINSIINTISKGECPVCKSSVKISKSERNVSVSDKLKALMEKRIAIEEKFDKLTKELNSISDEIYLNDSKYINNIAKIDSLNKELSIYLERLKGIKKLNPDKLNKSLQDKRKMLGSEYQKYNDKFIEESYNLFGTSIDFSSFDENNDFRSDVGILYGKPGNVYKLLLEASEVYEKVKLEASENIKKVEGNLLNKFNKYNILNSFTLDKIVIELDKEYDIKYTVFVPKYKKSLEEEFLNNGIRYSENEICTSELILLDYAFRLAIIELYMDLSKNPTFIAFETSQGTLDSNRVKKYAHMLRKYSKTNNMICITNLNDEKFPTELLKEIDSIEDKRSKITNFLDITSKNIENKEYYEEMLKRILN